MSNSITPSDTSLSNKNGNTWYNRILCGNSKDVLLSLPKGIANTIVTSPPYFSQRDYNHPNQIGSEATQKEYIERLVEVLRAAKEALSDDGTLWLNLGDKYKNGQLCGMPWRVALALVDDGWILRSDIIWQKPNAMPSSVKSRPTTDHEYIFLFSKQNKYFYDADAIREPHVTFSEHSKMKGGRGHFGKSGGTPEKGKNEGNPNLHHGQWDKAFHPKGRNKRTVWSVSLSKFRGAHFAVFPEGLIEPCILAGTQKGGCVLDPFFGSGTTGMVAKKNGRTYIGIDINKDYCEIANNRLDSLLL
ncbi:site-specific DNA-methyltransferase [Hellea sp.]|nr:site-specific DNA-methyltransferase [Hellea sp.]